MYYTYLISIYLSVFTNRMLSNARTGYLGATPEKKPRNTMYRRSKSTSYNTLACLYRLRIFMITQERARGPRVVLGCWKLNVCVCVCVCNVCARTCGLGMHVSLSRFSGAQPRLTRATVLISLSLSIWPLMASSYWCPSQSNPFALNNIVYV